MSLRIKKINYGIIVGKFSAQLLMLSIPVLLPLTKINPQEFYQHLFLFTIGIFLCRFGSEYFLFNDEDDREFNSALRTMKAVLCFLVILFAVDELDAFLLMNLGGYLSYRVISMRLQGRFSGWPYFLEGLIALILCLCQFIWSLTFVLSVLSAFLMLKGKYSIDFRDLIKGLGVMSNTGVSLLTANIFPLMVLVDLELFYIYTKAGGIASMASTYGNLLYQRDDNQRSLQTIRQISLYQLPFFLLAGCSYVLYNNLNIIWTFFLASLINVITGPVQIDLLRLKKSHLVLKASLMSVMAFLILVFVVKLDSLLWIGLAYSFILIIENATSYLYLKKVNMS